MYHKIRVLIAEDTVEGMEAIRKQLDKITDTELEIKECESFQEARQRITESAPPNEPYHFLFIDIDFSGDKKGGRRDSGFELIKKAFEVCPVSKISTYSAQYKILELEPTHQELVKKGLVVRTFDKDHRYENPRDWFIKKFNELLLEFKNERWIWDIWKNHSLILESLKVTTLSNDKFDDVSKKLTIQANLESILVLLRNMDKFSELPIIYRLILQLYHRCLEIFVVGDKTEDMIYDESETVKSEVFQFVEDLIKKEEDRDFKSKNSFPRKLAAHSPTKIFRYGHILNWLRNKSVHKMDFEIVREYLLFANLVLSAYVISDKSLINFSNFTSEPNSPGRKDLEELKTYLKPNIQP